MSVSVSLSAGSSPLPSLGSSPPPAWYSRPVVTGASALKQTLGGHSRPEADGDGGAPRRRRRAAFSRSSRFDLPQLLLLKSTCELARAAGVGVLSGGVCERASARGARSLSRGHGGSGEYLARSHYFTLYEALPLTAFARTASGGG